MAKSVPDGVDLAMLSAPPVDALPPTATVHDHIVHAAVSCIPQVQDIAQLVADMCSASRHETSPQS